MTTDTTTRRVYTSAGNDNVIPLRPGTSTPAARPDATQRAMDNAIATALTQIDDGGNRINALETLYRAGQANPVPRIDELAARRTARHRRPDDAS